MVSCVIVYVTNNDEKPFSGNDAMASAVEIICGEGINEVTGTGFIIDHNGPIVISNSHVVVTNGVVNENIFAVFYNSEEKYPLSVISFDEALDIAVLKFDNAIKTNVFIFGESGRLSYGQNVYAIGNSMGYGLSLSKGIISVPLINVKYSGNERLMIQVDIGLNRGGSGGPLLDEGGKVIGMMTFRLNGGDYLVQGMSYAIPSDVIQKYLDSL
ncbi:S1C family serine protease [Candidatus Methanoplasma termitum]|uniref:S1C family serine protease n=1 Tax=Candidatus Methanoplasma termitum TaxID=1577791 RepID=UPI00130E1608|nr:S1C family serine protease [Candidatus Methanoplasma termitum]